MKNHGILFLICFIILVFAPVPVFFLFREQIGYKNTENKAQSEFPEITAENYSTWTKRFEEWFLDVLPFKTQFIELYRGFQLHSGQDFVQSDVVRGIDNHLFYRKTIENYKGIDRFTDNELEKIRHNLEELFDPLSRHGAECLLYIAPDKEQVYPSLMPARIQRISEESRGDQVVSYLTDKVSFPVLYPKRHLTELSLTDPVYYTTDTHWNNLGGWIAAAQVRTAFTGAPLPKNMPQFHYYKSEGKDLAGMLGLSEQIPEQNGVAIDYNDGISVWKPETVDHGKLQRFMSDAPVQKKMLLIGDSFSEYFMQSAIHDITEIHFVTYGELYRINLDEEDPDYVVVMLVERNLPFLVHGFY